MTPVEKIAGSRLFSLEWYCLQSKLDLTLEESIRDYLEGGAAAGLNPNPFFDSRWYLEEYPDVKTAGVNPLLHYIENGEEEGRLPSDLFDPSWYRSRYRDVEEAGISPLVHYLMHGQEEKRHPNALASDPSRRARMTAVDAKLLPHDLPSQLRLEFEVCAVASVPEWETFRGSYAPASDAHGLPFVGFPPAPAMVHARDVGVLGGARALFKKNGQLVADELAHFRDATVEMKIPNARRMDGDRKVRLSVTRRYGTRVQCGIHAMHEYDSNYFHFVTETLPRILFALEEPRAAGLPLLVTKGLHPNLRTLLDLLIGPRPTIDLDVGHMYYVEDLWFPQDVSAVQDVYTRARIPSETAIHVPLVRAVRDRLMAAQGVMSDPKRMRKIYIHRGKRRRSLKNEGEISELLVRRGFELLTLDELTVAAQMTIFAEASIVVGATGAALTNMIWCKPGTQIIVMAANHAAMPLEIWTQLSAVSSCALEFVSGERSFEIDGLYAVHDHFEVPPAALLDALGRAEKALAKVGALGAGGETAE